MAESEVNKKTAESKILQQGSFAVISKYVF